MTSNYSFHFTKGHLCSKWLVYNSIIVIIDWWITVHQWDVNKETLHCLNIQLIRIRLLASVSPLKFILHGECILAEIRELEMIFLSISLGKM